MKISINQKSILTSGIQLANQGKYNQALALFCRDDSYEGMLNTIGCLCLMDDLTTACDVFLRMLAIYGDSYDCLADVDKMSDCTGALLSNFDSYKDAIDNFRKQKRRVKRSLVGYFAYDGDLMDNFYVYNKEEVLRYLENTDFQIEIPTQRFAVVGSDDYYEQLLNRFAQAQMEDDTQLIKLLSEQIMQTDCNYWPLLSEQIMLSIEHHNVNLAVKVATKLTQAEHLEPHTTYHLVNFLVENHCDGQIVADLLVKLASVKQQFPTYCLMDLLYYSSTIAHNDSLTADFADEIMSKSYVIVDALKYCLYAYVNNKQADKALQVASNLSQYTSLAPWATVVQQMLQQGKLLTKVDIKPRIEHHYHIPIEVYQAWANQLNSKVTNKERFNKEDYTKYYFLVQYTKSLGMSNHSTLYFVMMEVCRQLGDAMIRDNAVHFTDVRKALLNDALGDGCVIEFALNQIVGLGPKFDMLVFTANGINLLATSTLGKPSRLLTSCLAFCAILYPIDVVKMHQAYRQIVKACGRQRYNKDSILAMSYAMLAIAHPNSNPSQMEMFQLEDSNLYIDFLSKTEQ